MKILHWAFILLAIILPVSIVCRVTVNSRFAALKDEVRINNAIDTATKDAIDQIIAVSGFEYDNEFGDIIDITPALAQETVNTFFHTLAVNYNIPFKTSDSTSLNEGSQDSYIKNYFGQYVPAVVVIAYDGFYVYSQEDHGEGYSYELSSKIPYTKTYSTRTGDYTIGYTLGDDIYFYYDEKCYSGRMMHNSIGEVENLFREREEGDDDSVGIYHSITNIEDLAAITNDMQALLYLLQDRYNLDVGDELLPTADVTNFLQDYVENEDGTYTVGRFHEKRRETIIKIISECLNQEINVDHNRYAELVGQTYDFYLPEITNDAWINTINDISVMAFVQGIPVGTTEGVYFNSYALGGSQIVQKEYIYGQDDARSEYSGKVLKIYHTADCPIINGGYTYNGVEYKKNKEDCWVFITEDDAINEGYISCQICN